MTLCHLVSRAAWEAARPAGWYAPASLAEVGFVHCAAPTQVAAVAARFYRDVPEVVVLVISPERAGAEVRWEAMVDGGERFPHLYGAVPVAAVIDVIPLEAWAP